MTTTATAAPTTLRNAPVRPRIVVDPEGVAAWFHGISEARRAALDLSDETGAVIRIARPVAGALRTLETVHPSRG